jgi:peptide/nickel transport system substrate-binding protein
VLTRWRDRRYPLSTRLVIGITSSIAVVTITASCRGQRSEAAHNATLRVGVARLSPTSTTEGLRQLAQLFAAESLVRLDEHGRLEPQLASAWTLRDEGRSVVFQLRQGIMFHDGSALTASTVATILTSALRDFMGPVFADITAVHALEGGQVEAVFQHPSPFLLEAFEAPILKQNGNARVGTGPFMLPADSPTQLVANPTYYLGRPKIQQITVTNYPSVRTAWAEMLRGNVDWLYDVTSDALSSLQGSSAVVTYKYIRHYQYALAFNVDAPAFKSREIRRALNFAVNRNRIKAALGGSGIPSTSPAWPQHWAFRSDLLEFTYDPGRAAAALTKGIRFTCVVPRDEATERLSLEVKRQLAEVGVEMDVEEVPQAQMRERLRGGRYDAALIEAISAPTFFRPYLFWHSKGLLNPGGLGNATVDAAFDRIRSAASEDQYRNAVAGIEQAFVDDPPAVFLAWSERARAVSKSFTVPQPEPGRDILGTVRLWTPTPSATQQVSRN